MLPRITSHGIDTALDGRKFLVVVHIEIQQQVSAEAVPRGTLTDILESGIQGSLRRTRRIETATRALRHIVTEVQVGTQVFEAMNLVIHLQVSQASSGSAVIVVLLQHGKRIDTGQGIREIRCRAIAFGYGFPGPIPVVTAIIVINRLGRVEESGSTHRTAFGKTGLVDGSLHVQVHRQMVIQKLRAKIQGSGISVIVRSAERTLFRIVSHRSTERHKTHLTAHTDVLVGRQARTEDFVLPIGRLSGILINHGLCRIAQCRALRILAEGGFTELVGSHHLHPLVRVFHRKGSGIMYLDTVLRTLLGSDDDHTVRCS